MLLLLMKWMRTLDNYRSLKKLTPFSVPSKSLILYLKKLATPPNQRLIGVTDDDSIISWLSGSRFIRNPWFLILHFHRPWFPDSVARGRFNFHFLDFLIPLRLALVLSVFTHWCQVSSGARISPHTTPPESKSVKLPSRPGWLFKGPLRIL